MKPMTRPSKAKRKLSDIKFEHEGAHLALVSKEQGGPANGHDYSLVLKSMKFSDEFIEKVQQIRVTMELPEFLEKFFGMFSYDAELLAAILGYEKNTEQQSDFDSWIKEKVKSFEILKAMYESESLAEVIAGLNEDSYLQVLIDQQNIERAFKAYKEPITAVSREESRLVSTKDASVEKSVGPTGSLDENKSKKETVMQENVELVAKAELDMIQKAFEEQKVALEKAMAQIAQYEQEKRESLMKARKAEVLAVVKDAQRTEILFKAFGKIEDEAEFKEVLKSLGEMLASVEKSALFEEKGIQLEKDTGVEESPVAKLIKARLNKK